MFLKLLRDKFQDKERASERKEDQNAKLTGEWPKLGGKTN